MPTCTFFGHRDCPESMRLLLKETIEKLIVEKSVREFLVGNNGNFDALVQSVLKEIKTRYDIMFSVALAYFPSEKDSAKHHHSILPDGIEAVPPKFAIDYRNRYMLKRADYVITYITHDFGTGAAKYAALARKKHKTVINLAE